MRVLSSPAPQIPPESARCNTRMHGSEHSYTIMYCSARRIQPGLQSGPASLRPIVPFAWTRLPQDRRSLDQVVAWPLNHLWAEDPMRAAIAHHGQFRGVAEREVLALADREAPREVTRCQSGGTAGDIGAGRPSAAGGAGESLSRLGPPAPVLPVRAPCPADRRRLAVRPRASPPRT